MRGQIRLTGRLRSENHRPHQVRTVVSSISLLTSPCREPAARPAGSCRFLRRPVGADPFCGPAAGPGVDASRCSPPIRSPGCIGRSAEIIYVDDCSRDGSLAVLQELCTASEGTDLRTRIVKFRRNYGQTAAMSAGFELAEGTVVFPLDADGQARFRHTIRDLVGYFAYRLEQRSGPPGDDLITRLTAARVGQDKLSTAQLLSLCEQLMVAGRDLSTGLIANGLRALLSHPAMPCSARSGIPISAKPGVPGALSASTRTRTSYGPVTYSADSTPASSASGLATTSARMI